MPSQLTAVAGRVRSRVACLGREARGDRNVVPGVDDEGQLGTAYGTRPPLPVRAGEAGADLGLEI